MAKPVNRFKNYHSGYVKKTITVNAKIAKIWRKVSDITSLSDWVIDVKKTIFLSKKKGACHRPRPGPKLYRKKFYLKLLSVQASDGPLSL